MLSEAEIDALEYVVEEGRIASMDDYGILRSLLVRLRPGWGRLHSDDAEYTDGISACGKTKCCENATPQPYPQSDERRGGSHISGSLCVLVDTVCMAVLSGQFLDKGWRKRLEEALVAYHNAASHDAVPAARATNCGQKPKDAVGAGNTFSPGSSSELINRNAERQSPASTEESAPLDDTRPDTKGEATGGRGHFHTPNEGSVPRDGTPEPVAWAVATPDRMFRVLAFSRQRAVEERLSASEQVVPLYAHPPQVVRLPAADEHHGGWLHTVESCVLERVQAALDAAGVKWEVEK